MTPTPRSHYRQITLPLAPLLDTPEVKAITKSWAERQQARQFEKALAQRRSQLRRNYTHWFRRACGSGDGPKPKPMTPLERQFLEDKAAERVPVNTGWNEYRIMKGELP